MAEGNAVLAAAEQIGPSFSDAVSSMLHCISGGGKIVVSGVGKSGIVAKKVAATLTSTGSMAVYLHPTEALHGDLGLIGMKDVLLVFSNGGSSEEIMQMIPAARELCSGVIAILGNTKGPISKVAQIVISSAVSAEACPDNLAPTTSSTVAMAIGDALAMALKKELGFGPENYARLHPGGSLGRRLHTLVRDIMHKEGEFAILPLNSTMDDVVIALTKYRHSGVCIVDGKSSTGKPLLAGIIVEGDIRRAISKKEGFFKLSAQDLMTKKPKSIGPDAKATEALELMESREVQLSFLPVIDESGGCVGVLRIHDLVLLGLN